MKSTKSKISINNISIVVLVIGIFGDEISTMAGLSTGRFYEANSSVRALISNGLWIPLDVLLMIILVLIPLYISKKGYHRVGNFMMIAPFIVGVVRLTACLSNISLMIQ